MYTCEAALFCCRVWGIPGSCVGSADLGSEIAVFHSRGQTSVGQKCQQIDDLQALVGRKADENPSSEGCILHNYSNIYPLFIPAYFYHYVNFLLTLSMSFTNVQMCIVFSLSFIVLLYFQIVKPNFR